MRVSSNVLTKFGEISVQILYMDINFKWSCFDFSSFEGIFKGVFQLSLKCYDTVAKTKKFHVGQEKI